MRTKTLLLLLLASLIGAFAVLNWSTFMVPTTLSLGLTTVELPLGLTMLAMLVLVTVVFAVYAVFWQGAVLMETRRHVKEMHAQRQLADQAEASRFTELRGVMHTELAQLGDRITASHESLRTEMRESTNSLAAMFGELDSRLNLPPADNAAPGSGLVRR